MKKHKRSSPAHKSKHANRDRYEAEYAQSRHYQDRQAYDAPEYGMVDAAADYSRQGHHRETQDRHNRHERERDRYADNHHEEDYREMRHTEDRRREKDDRRSHRDAHDERAKYRSADSGANNYDFLATDTRDGDRSDPRHHAADDSRHHVAANSRHHVADDSRKHVTAPPPKPAAAADNGDDDDDDDYDDDFEDYGDDFENEADVAPQTRSPKDYGTSLSPDSEKPDSAKQKLRWNKASKGPGPSQSDDRAFDFGLWVPDKFEKLTEAGNASNFQYRKMLQRRKKKVKDLLGGGLVTLTLSRRIDLADFPPLTPYEVLIHYGNSRVRQARSQTNDDAIEMDIQTDEIEFSDASMQFPEDVGSGSGTGGLGRSVHSGLHAVTFSRFLKKSSSIMSSVLEENLAESYASRLHAPVGELSRVAEATHTLPMNKGLFNAVMKNRTLTALTCGWEGTVLAVFSPHTPAPPSAFPDFHTRTPVKTPADVLTRKAVRTVLLLWNVDRPAQNVTVLTTAEIVTACCIRDEKPFLVFAGSDTGGIIVWDLREPDTWHDKHKFGEEEMRFRRESFVTTGTWETNHRHPVSKVICFREELFQVPFFRHFDTHEFQVLSCDEGGRAFLWSVVDTSISSDAMARVQGRVRLEHLMTIDPYDSLRTVLSPLNPMLLPVGKNTDGFGTRVPETLRHATDIAICGSDKRDFVVAVEGRLILRASRYGGNSGQPVAFIPTSAGIRRDDTGRILPIETPLSTTFPVSIRVSPYFPRFFLVSYSDGMLCLFSDDTALPRWVGSLPMNRKAGVETQESCVQCAVWSAHRPAVFYALDVTGQLHVYDLLCSTPYDPAFSMSTLTQNVKASKLCSAVCRNAQFPLAQNIDFYLAYENGQVIGYILSDDKLPPRSDERRLVDQYLRNLP